MKLSRKLFFYLAVLFALCVAAQVFIAGLATFSDPGRWRDHVMFVRFFESLPLLMLIFSFIGKMPHRLRWMSFMFLLFIVLMYATANLAGPAPLVGAFHPVIALVMFWLAVSILPNAWKLAHRGQEAAQS